MSLTKREYWDEICERMPSYEPEWDSLEEYQRERDEAARYADAYPRTEDTQKALNWLNRSVLDADNYQEILGAL